jgi:O-antigen/teichoic acid export membrane protein
MIGPVSEQSAPRSRIGSTLAIGSGVGGLLAYVFFVLVTRGLGAERAAPVSILWVWWSFAGAALTFPIQHWIARSATVHGGEAGVRRALPGVAGIIGAAAVVSVGVAWLARETPFGLPGTAFPLLIGGVTLGSGSLGVLRGLLTARRRFGGVAASLVTENALRTLVALVLLVVGVKSPEGYGLALLAGYLIVLIWPSALVATDDGDHDHPDSPLAFLGGASTGQLLAQAVLTGGPILLASAGGSPAEVTAFFVALAVFRAPYTLALGLVSPLTSRLTGWVLAGEETLLATFRRRTVLATLGTVVAAILVAPWLGPPLLDLIFGVRPAGLVCGLVAVASTFAISNLVLAITVLARGGTSVLVRSWLAAYVPGIVVFLIGSIAVSERTAWTFLAIEAVAWLLLLVEDLRRQTSSRSASITRS